MYHDGSTKKTMRSDTSINPIKSRHSAFQ